MMKRALFLVIAALTAACGSDKPVQVAGTYTIALTVQKDDCGILGNQVGETTSDVKMVIMQATGSSQITAEVQGLAGLALGISMGTATFTGVVSGSTIDASISGTMAGSSGTCAYTRNARLVATLSGDTVQGSVVYTYATNKTADCGSKATCQDIQLMNGTRPPTI